MIVDEKIIDDYIELHDRIDKLFTEYKLEKKQFSEVLGMTRQTFSRKLKNKSFLASEMMELAKHINKMKA